MSGPGHRADDVPARGPRRSAGVAALVALGGTLAGAFVGAVPAIIARKTFLAPQPGSGLEDLGPALLAFGMGALGMVCGAVGGFFAADWWLRRLGFAKSALRNLALLVALPFALPLLVFGRLFGAVVLAAIGLTLLVRFGRTNR